MPNPFFNAMGMGQQGASRIAQFGNIMQMLPAFKANPIGFLLKQKLNVPSEIVNDPNAILQHLLSTGQISQNQLNAAYQEIQNGGLSSYGRQGN